MPTVVQDVSGDSALQTAIAALKAKIEGAEESSDIAQAISQINTALAGKQNTLTFDSAPSSGSFNPVTSDGVKTALDGKQDTLIFDTEPTAESTKPVTSGGVKEALDDMYSEISDRIAAAEEDIDIRGGAIYESASGSLVEITDGGDNLPMKSAVVTMEPIQEGSGDPSPENVRPISGRTGLSVVRSGKNLLGGAGMIENAKAIKEAAGASRPIIDETANTIIFNAVQDNGRQLFTTKFKENTVYSLIFTFSKNQDTRNSNIQIIYTDNSAEWVLPLPATVAYGEKGTVLFTSASGKTIKDITVGNQGTTTTLYCNESGIFEGVLTSDDFEPYKGSTYTVNWESEAGTVYGGTLDVSTGELVVDRVADALTGQETINAFDVYYIVTNTHAHPTWTAAKVLCSHFAQSGTNSVAAGNSQTNVWFRLDKTVADFATLEAFRSYIANQYTAGTPVTISYKLATPITYALTPQEVRTLLGENNIWSDAGSMAVEYPADTKTYIDNKIAEAIAAALA